MSFPRDPRVACTQGTKRTMRRASQACVRCRTRKVRCDVTIRGSPCMNCSLDGHDCEVTHSKRNASRYSIQPSSAYKGSTGVRRDQISPGSYNARRNDLQGSFTSHTRNEKSNEPRNPDDGPQTTVRPNLKGSPRATTLHGEESGQVQGRDEQSDRPTNASEQNTCHQSDAHMSEVGSPERGSETLAFMNVENQCQLEGPEMRKDGRVAAENSTSQLPSYVSYSHYSFLAIGNISSISSEDYQFLEQQGCLHVPARQTLDAFIRHYFLHLHPLLPILHEGFFWDMYSHDQNEHERGASISLLLFQSMLFACCNFVPQNELHKIGLSTIRQARATFYRRAKLLFDLDTEVSSITMSQAALLLASWSFSSYDLPRKPTTPWLSIAVQHARDVDAHNYDSLDVKSEDYVARKRLWWCCIIRDRMFGLGMRRSLLITQKQFDVSNSNMLGYYDLREEADHSRVHDTETKILLAKVLELLVKLCAVLTHILELAFPMEESLKSPNDGSEVMQQIQNIQFSLTSWQEYANSRLPSFSKTSHKVTSGKHHDSVVLFINLLNMYYHSARVTLGHYEILQTAKIALLSPTSSASINSLTKTHLQLQNAILGTTSCLARLEDLQLVKWLPVTAVSCTALPLLLHVLGMEISPYMHGESSSYLKSMKSRLGVLRTAMKTYQFQYEGVKWINEMIDRVVALARADLISKASRPRMNPAKDSGAEKTLNMLIFQPGWYLRLAFSIDVVLSKGRLPHHQNFLRSFRELIEAEIGQPINVKDGAREKKNCPHENLQSAQIRIDGQSVADYSHAVLDPKNLATEPFYLITDVEESCCEVNLFEGFEDGVEEIFPLDEGIERGLSIDFRCGEHPLDHEYPLEDIVMEDISPVDELDLLTMWTYEGIDASNLLSGAVPSTA